MASVSVHLPSLLGGWDVPVSDGDTILFMQAVSGG